jgi:hypothetical protein
MCRKTKYCNNNKIRRQEWTSHLVRLSDDRTVKKVLLGKPTRIRKTGRPKLRWLYCTDKVWNRWVSTDGRRRKQICMSYHLKEALLQLEGPHASGKKRRFDHYTFTHHFPRLCFIISLFTEDIVAEIRPKCAKGAEYYARFEILASRTMEIKP